MRTTSLAGQQFIANQEWRPRSKICGWDEAKQLYFPYKDYRGYLTIGIGHLTKGGEDFSAGLTEFAVMQVFAGDLAPVEKAVNHFALVELTQHQFDAWVDFGFNEGIGRLDPNDTPSNPGGNSAMRALNAGHYDQVPKLFEPYCISAGSHDPNLLRRRQAEGIVFQTPDPPEGVSSEAQLAYAKNFGLLDLIPYHYAIESEDTPPNA